MKTNKVNLNTSAPHWDAPGVPKNYFSGANIYLMPRPTIISQTSQIWWPNCFWSVSFKMIFFPKIFWCIIRKKLSQGYNKKIRKKKLNIFMCVCEKIAFIFTLIIFKFRSYDKNCISHNNTWRKVDKIQKGQNLCLILNRFTTLYDFVTPFKTRVVKIWCKYKSIRILKPSPLLN